MMLYRIICLVIGYFCGCISSGYFVGKLYHMDIRTKGSGNAGTTNVLRTLGKLPALITFVGDLAKAIVPIVIIRCLYGGRCIIGSQSDHDTDRSCDFYYCSRYNTVCISGIIICSLVYPGEYIGISLAGWKESVVFTYDDLKFIIYRVGLCAAQTEYCQAVSWYGE